MLSKLLYFIFGVKLVKSTIIYKLSENGDLNKINTSNFLINKCLNCNEKLHYDENGSAICEQYLYIVTFEE